MQNNDINIQDCIEADIQSDNEETKQNEANEVLNPQNIEPEENITSETDVNIDTDIIQDVGVNFEEKKNMEQDIANSIKSNIENDLKKIDKLIQCGLLNPQMGQIFKKQVLQKAFDNIVETEKNKFTQNNSTDIYEEFNNMKPDFFKHDGRKEVLNYLKNETKGLKINELNKISEIVKLVEKSAISRYLKQIAHDKNLKESNEQAKQKLTANAQTASGGINLSHSFTREQIGKMSCAEFAKYEKEIMTQLKAGKIK